MSYGRSSVAPKIIIAGLFILICFGGCSAYKGTEDTVTLTVNKYEERNRGESGSIRLIYTDKGVYQCSDAFFTYGHTSSSDVYGEIEKNKTYEATVVGWRNSFLSWYPNIIKVTEVKDDK